MTGSIVIAVDGTAASGKGTLAKELARHFGFAHLDSGSLYRLVALETLKSGGDPRSPSDAIAAAGRIDPSHADTPDIRRQEIAEAASLVSAVPEVRQKLLAFQRDFAESPPGGASGAVIDGRDIGTVVCPSAQAKLFVDAKPEIRARRRWLELSAAGRSIEESAVLNDIRTRDVRDKGRAVAPLMAAPDAVLLDTSDLDIDAAFAAALALVKPRVEEALKARPRG